MTILKRLTINYLDKIKVNPDYAMPVVIVITGLFCGFAAVSFKSIIHILESFLFLNKSFILPHNLQYLIIPLTSAFGVGLIVWKIYPESKGGGIPQIKAALFYQYGIIPSKDLVGKFITAVLCIGGGLAVCPEGPTIFICAAIGAWLGKIFSFKQMQIKNLVISGAAGGLAAAFNTPISGIMFAFEELIGNLSTKIVGASIVSCVLASTLQRLLTGNNPSLNVPKHNLVQPFELFYYIILGVFCGIVSYLLIKTLLGISKKFSKPGGAGFKKMVLPMTASGLIVGICAMYLPSEITGFGYLQKSKHKKITAPNVNVYASSGSIVKPIEIIQTKINSLENQSPEIFGPASSMYKQLEDLMSNRMDPGLILYIFLFKFFIVSICFIGRPPGGIFLPVIFIGAMAGGLIGVGVNITTPMITGDVGAYALVGMGAIIAGVMKTPITAILIIFEMTNNYDIILPLMLACMISYSVSRYFYKHSIYDGILRNQGIFLSSESLDLKSVRVSDVMNSHVKTIPHNLSVSDALLNFNFFNFYSFPVVDDNGKIAGILKRYMLKEKIKKEDWFAPIKDVIADQELPFIYETDSLDRAIKLLGSFETNVLPVLNNPAEKKPVGIISHNNVIKFYSKKSQEMQ